jgi:hypothetical protein
MIGDRGQGSCWQHSDGSRLCEGHGEVRPRAETETARGQPDSRPGGCGTALQGA